MEQQQNNEPINNNAINRKNDKKKQEPSATNYASYETWSNADMWKADGVEN